MFRLFADNMPALGWIANADGYISWYNKRWHEYCGTTPEEMEGWGWQSVHDPDLLPSVLERWARSIATGDRFEMTFPLRGADGLFRRFLTRVEPVRGEDGTISHWFGTNTDVSAQVAAEEALREARARSEALAAEHAAILSQLAEGVIVADRDGQITFVNKAAQEIHGTIRLGIAPGEYSIAYHLYREDGRPYPSEELPLARAVRGQTVGEERWLIRRSDGAEVVAAGAAQPLLDSDGGQMGAVLTVRDDTARVSAEQQVRENEARLRALTDNLPGGMVYQVTTGREGDERRFLYVSQSHEKLTGVPAEDVLADSSIPYFLILPEDRQRLVEAEAEAIRTRTTFDVEARFRHVNGEIRWSRVISAPREQPDGSLIWDGVQIDITDARHAQERLRELNETLEAQVAERTQERDRIWRLSGHMFGIFDLTGRLKRANPAWTSILGLLPEEIEGKHHSELRHPDDWDMGDEAVAQLERGATLSDIEDRYRHKDGSYRWISWTAAAPEGDLIFAVGRDVTAEKERQAQLDAAQEALRQSQKMEAMGQLTGGVAHDFNNLLTPIVGGLDLLQRRGLGGERERRLIEGALASAERAKTLVQRLLAFARRQPLQACAVNVAALIRGMGDLIESTAGPQVKVVLQVAEPLPAAVADANQLEMALLNLAVNARDAMPDGGTLTISANAEQVDAGCAQRLKRGEYVRLYVADTGVGMDQEVLARAAEPFFSTKGVGRGTGLGLSMVHGLAQQLGGELSISSKSGLGTRVDLWLPASAAAAEIADGPSNAPASRGEGIVLLVEDEELVRMSTADMLCDLGYEVVDFACPREALKALQDGLKADILVSDHLMPGMTGTDLIRQIRARRPELPALLVSGYAEAEGVAPDLPRLTKPFRQADLAASLAALKRDGGA
jgi:PAS domain S-box-containing protein